MNGTAYNAQFGDFIIYDLPVSSISGTLPDSSREEMDVVLPKTPPPRPPTAPFMLQKELFMYVNILTCYVNNVHNVVLCYL